MKRVDILRLMSLLGGGGYWMTSSGLKLHTDDMHPQSVIRAMRKFKELGLVSTRKQLLNPMGRPLLKYKLTPLGNFLFTLLSSRPVEVDVTWADIESIVSAVKTLKRLGMYKNFKTVIERNIRTIAPLW